MDAKRDYRAIWDLNHFDSPCRAILLTPLTAIWGVDDAGIYGKDTTSWGRCRD